VQPLIERVALLYAAVRSGLSIIQHIRPIRWHVTGIVQVTAGRPGHAVLHLLIQNRSEIRRHGLLLVLTLRHCHLLPLGRHDVTPVYPVDAPGRPDPAGDLTSHLGAAG
jgi:hypothetical protein